MAKYNEITFPYHAYSLLSSLRRWEVRRFGPPALTEGRHPDIEQSEAPAEPGSARKPWIKPFQPPCWDTPVRYAHRGYQNSQWCLISSPMAIGNFRQIA
jgi:hypothetical protein